MCDHEWITEFNWLKSRPFEKGARFMWSMV